MFLQQVYTGVYIIFPEAITLATDIIHQQILHHCNLTIVGKYHIVFRQPKRNPRGEPNVESDNIMCHQPHVSMPRTARTNTDEIQVDIVISFET